MAQTFLDIDLKPAPLAPKKHLLITDEIIRWGDKSLNTKDIIAVKYGSIAMVTMGIQTNQNYSFKFLAQDKKDLSIYFSSVSLASPNQRTEDAFITIENAVWDAITGRIMDGWINDFNSGSSFTVGDAVISNQGMKIKVSKLFSSREVFLVWDNVSKELYNGYLEIKSKQNKKDNCSFNIQNDWNAITLYYFLNWLWKEKGRTN